VRELLQAGLSAAKAAEQLRTEGYKTARGIPFSESCVRATMRRLGILSTRSLVRQEPDLCGPHECFISELTRELQIGPAKVYGRIMAGTIPARRAKDGRWVVTVDEEMRKALQSQRKYAPTNTHRKPPDAPP